MIVGWIVFPLLLALLCAGCGAAVERLAGGRVAGPLVLPLGLAALIVVAHPFTLSDATAELALPALLVLTVAGLLLARGRRPRVDPWAAACALAVFAAYAAPVALSGDAVVAGYIKLDDSSSWLALAERAGEQGTSYAGLAPSTYEAMLDFYLGGDYPLGGLLPLAVGDALLGGDDLRLYQPYVAFLAAMLALCLYAIAARLIRSRPLRALAVFVAAQPALLYAYGLWGGSKEVATAWLVALVAALVEPVLRDRVDARALVPLAVAGAATLAVLSLGGGVWLAPFAGPALVVAMRREGATAALRRLGAFAVLVAVLAVPSLLSAGFLGSSAVPLTETSDRTGLANLLQPLSPLQALGIWPTGEFRLEPGDMAPVYVLLAVAFGAFVVGVAGALRERAWTPLAYVAASTAGAVVVLAFGTAWLDAKALAAVSPAFVLIALGGAGAIAASGRRVEAAVVAAAIAGGVLWSNVLGYHEVQLTPTERFAELREIGEAIAGEGPTLVTEFEPYAGRFFLRDADPEVASELRRRQVLLRTGAPLERARSADIDAFQLPAVLIYRTLVLRRSPFSSRPPAPYELVRRGRFYEVWQRDGITDVAEHLPLGEQPARCADVLRLAEAGDRLAYAPAPPEAARVPLDARTFTLGTAGEHEVWVGGSWRGRLTVRIDGRLVPDRRHELNHGAPFTSVARLDLAAGEHTLAVEHDTGGLHPGSGGSPFLLGPVVVAPVRDIGRFKTIPAAQARSLCGRRLDWIEALP